MNYTKNKGFKGAVSDCFFNQSDTALFIYSIYVKKEFKKDKIY